MIPLYNAIFHVISFTADMVFKDLRPEKVWYYFEEICKIPRLSKDEGKIRQFLLDFARDNKLESKTDRAGNVLITKPADPGYEDRKSVVLQSHMDMVGEKDSGVMHDWKNDPVKPYIEGDWVKAKDTTLGADDGIGIAVQLALLTDKNIKTGILECLFTVDEESGMTGAIDLEENFFKSKILINLDSEDEGELFIGCAGGMDTVIDMSFELQQLGDPCPGLRLSITGLQGGHSGDEIHKGHANSVKLMNGLLILLNKQFNIRISDFKAGNLRNAIPREAFAEIAYKEDMLDAIISGSNEYFRAMKAKYSVTEPDMRMNVEKIKPVSSVMNQDAQTHLLESVNKCPHGVIAWSEDMKDLVETSTNLASVEFKGNLIRIVTSQRSSVESAKLDIAGRIKQVFAGNNTVVKHSDGYPGWKPDTDSVILKITRQSYISLFGKEPVVRAIHAGLECGLFLKKYPDMDMISFGPTIKGAHTPQERLNIESTKKFWDLLVDVINKIPVN